MNVRQANFSSTPNSAANPAPKAIEPEQAQKFQTQMSIATNENALFKRTDQAVAKEQDAKKQSESAKLEDKEQRETELQAWHNGMVAETKVNARFGANEQSENFAQNQSSFKKLGQETGQVRFQKSVENIKGKIQEKAANKEVAQQEQVNLTKGQTNQAQMASFSDVLQGEGSETKQSAGQAQFTKQADQLDASNARKPQLQQFTDAAKTVTKMDPSQMARDFSQQQQMQQQMNQATKGAESLGGKTALRTATVDGGQNTTNFTAGKTDASKGQPAEVRQKMTTGNTQEVVDKVKVMINSKKTEMIMKLTPEHLGKLEVKLKKAGDSLIGQFKVESLAAKELVENSMDQLRANLSEQGVNFDEIQVSVRGDGQTEHFNFAQDGGQNQSGQQSGTQTASTGMNEKAFDPEMTNRPKVNVNDGSALNIYA